MPNWKKVIVSGSNAELNQVTASYFKGDGSALTNLAGSPIENYYSASDNRVITSLNSSTVHSEQNLIFNGSQLQITGSLDSSGKLQEEGVAVTDTALAFSIVFGG